MTTNSEPTADSEAKVPRGWLPPRKGGYTPSVRAKTLRVTGRKPATAPGGAAGIGQQHQTKAARTETSAK